MKIVYLHGLHSSPMSYKRKVLEDMGHTVFAPHLPASDWKGSVSLANKVIANVKPDVVIGSSRGGAVAMAVDPSCPMVLIAPAYTKYCPEAQLSADAVILHSAFDDIIAYADSVELIGNGNQRLYKVGRDHRMNDEEAISTLTKLLPVDAVDISLTI